MSLGRSQWAGQELLFDVPRREVVSVKEGGDQTNEPYVMGLGLARRRERFELRNCGGVAAGDMQAEQRLHRAINLNSLNIQQLSTESVCVLF
jgi:hypothetical protein